MLHKSKLAFLKCPINMLCCSLSWYIKAGLCVVFIPLILLLYFTGHIKLLPEVTKLLLAAIWCYLDAILNWIVPRKCKNIEGLTAVVTGAGHGIGREISLALARKGWTRKFQHAIHLIWTPPVSEVRYAMMGMFRFTRGCPRVLQPVPRY